MARPEARRAQLRLISPRRARRLRQGLPRPQSSAAHAGAGSAWAPRPQLPPSDGGDAGNPEPGFRSHPRSGGSETPDGPPPARWGRRSAPRRRGDPVQACPVPAVPAQACPHGSAVPGGRHDRASAHDGCLRPAPPGAGLHGVDHHGADRHGNDPPGADPPGADPRAGDLPSACHPSACHPSGGHPSAGRPDHGTAPGDHRDPARSRAPSCHPPARRVRPPRPPRPLPRNPRRSPS